ncbi:hypothetical protein O181_109704 [Austropuccinia psidii MF-1]|uniref:Uncharacterized protein n=1 Tax=Austropuccinia psidii MF-1 TaxID=1389203 RepID=A0A9Q3PQ53_9BASI|nr:hypothetical protein [Austropuccinia psidii MF-1]
MPSTRAGASYNPSSSSQKCYSCDCCRSQSVTEGADTATRSLSGHIKSHTKGLQQCIAAQRVPDPFKSVEKLHELLPDCKKISGPSQHLQVTQWMESIDGKDKYMILLTAEWRKNNPPPPKRVPKQPQQPEEAIST